VDSEVIAAGLEKAGFRQVAEPELADVLLINTCAFIQEAVEESVDAVISAGRYRTEGKARLLVVAGCLPQRYGGKLGAALSEADLFVGCSELSQIPKLLSTGSAKRVVVGRGTSHLAGAEVERRPSVFAGAHSAYVKVAEGCNRKCAFCTVPAIRGRQKSRTVADVVTEVRALAAQGVKEVNLVAQDLTAYGRDLKDRPRLSDLLTALGRVDGLKWLRTLYLYPSAVTVRLLKTMAEVPQVVPYLEVPVQHAAERVLEAMRRGYGARSVRRVMERIRKHMPDAFVRTTLMVGHPSETRKAFEELKRFVKEFEPDHMGVFAYSREEGTASAKMRPSVKPVEAETRRDELMEIQRAISARKLGAMKGKALTVLVDGPSEEFQHLYVGRHAGQAPEIDGVTYLTAGESADSVPVELRPGMWVNVRVEQTSDYDLAGPVVSEGWPGF
jgi:ribosomal protein S12 methylthiotransferase